jgi:hypothetical protein
MRTARGHALPRNFTQRNLAATLALVDRDATRESPLLTVPSAAHGGTGPIATALEAAQWENVARWIDELSQPPAGAPLDSVARREAVLWQPAAQPPVGTAANAAAKPGAAPRDDSHPLGDFTPRDPFDPEIFNRRHFKPEAVRPRGG